DRLANAQALQAFASSGSGRLYDDEGSVVEQLGKLLRETQGWTAVDATLGEIAARLQALTAETQDVAATLRSLAQGYAADPARREVVEERVRLLRRLETKYDRTLDELIAYHGTLEERERQLQQQEDDRTTVERALQTAFAE